MKVSKYLFASMLLAASTSWATPLTFSAGTQADFDDVTQCIFGGSGTGGCPILVGSSGSAPGATPTGSPGASYVGDSWTYTVGDIVSFLGGVSLFNLVIDSNWSSGGGNGADFDSEFLDLFEVRINGVVMFDYSGGNAMDFGLNGNGNENWLLSTVDLSAFALTDLVDFHLEMSDLTDGFEQVAMIAAGFNPGPGPNPMPEPSVLLLFGVGLIGLAARRRRLIA